MNKAWLLIIICYLAHTIKVAAQKDTIYHAGPYSYGAVLSPDESTAAYINFDSIFRPVLHLLDTKSFTQLDSILLPTQPQTRQYIWDLDFLGNSKKYLTVRKRQIADVLEWRDTVYILNLEEKKFDDLKFFGDDVIDYSFEHKEFIVGNNTFKRALPKEKKGVLKTSLKSTIEFGENKIKYPGQILDIELSPDEASVVLVFFVYKSEMTNYFEVQTRSVPDLNLLVSKTVLDWPKKILFSDTSEEVLLLKSQSGKEYEVFEKLELLRFPSLENVKVINKKLQVPGRIKNGNAWVFDFGLKKIEYNSGRKLLNILNHRDGEHHITEFLINQDTLISFDRNKIYKYSISENEYLDRAGDVIQLDTLLTHNKPNILFNSFPDERHHLFLNGLKHLFVLEEGKISVWDTSTKRKVKEQLFKYKFEDSKLHLEGNHLKVLISESDRYKNYSPLEYFDFERNKVQRNKYKSGILTFEETSYPKVGSWKFFYFPSIEKWFCWDGKLEIWEFFPNADNLFTNKDKDVSDPFTVADILPGNFYFEKAYTFERAPKNIMALDGRNEIIIKFNDNNNLSLFNIQYFKFQQLRNSLNFDILSQFSKSKLLIRKKPNLLLTYDLITGEQKVLNRSLADNVHFTKFDTNKVVLMEGKDLGYDKYYEKLMVFDNQTNELLDTIPLEVPSFYNLVLNYPEAIYSSNKKLASINLESKSEFNWNTLENDDNFEYKKVLKTNREEVFFFNKYLVNFQNLTLKKVTSDSSITSAIFIQKDTAYIGSILKKEDPHLKSFFRIEKLFENSNPPYESGVLPHYEDRMVIKVADDSNHLLAYPENSLGGYFYLYDLANNQWHKESLEKNRIIIQTGFGHYPTIKNISFTEDSKFLLIYCSKFSSDYIERLEKTFLYDLETSSIVRSFDSKLNHIYKNGNAIYSEDNLTVDEGHFTNGNLVKKQSFYGTNKYIFMYDNQHNIFLSFDNGKLLVYRDSVASPIEYIDLMSTSEVVDVTSDIENLYVAMTDGSIKVIDAKSFELKLTLHIFKKNKSYAYLFLTPEGYFSAPKEVIRNFHFVKGFKTFPLLNYEIFLNRPDIILDRLGFADQASIDIYKQAHLKRLKRNGLTPKVDLLSLPTPEIKLVNANEIPEATTDKELILELKTSKDSRKIITYINSVPVATTIPNEDVNIMEQRILLNAGTNKISIIARNKNGVESDPENFEIINTNTSQTSKTYFIGIGVSKYQDSTMTLTYADKDVHALTKVFKDMYGENLVVDTLTNNTATYSNITALKERLKSTSVNDRIILSFSGHGLVDENLDFYFSPYEMDFSNPALNGFSYEQMQDLLTDIPARKKLMLIDACHSGELDNEADYNKIIVDNTNISSNIPKGTKGSIAIGDNKSGNLQNSFDLMRSLFYDLDRGNGSYVISAAGGLEYAFEDDTWRNGVFTYSIIQGLNELRGEENGNDGIITVSELKNYVEDKVQHLTKGHQKPTSRSENIEWDWQLN